MRRLTKHLRCTVAATAKRTWPNRLWAASLALALLGWPACLFAQTPPAPVPTVSRSWYFDALIVVVMMGLALFVVCRSSRRN